MELTEQDKKDINSYLEQTVPKDSKNMDSTAESRNSVTFTATSPEGFDVLVTHREEDDDKFMTSLVTLEKQLTSLGFKPKVYKKYDTGQFPAKETAKKVVEYVEGRVCPDCRSPLVYFEFKGKKHIKCSTAKWDYKTKTNIGCEFTEWAK